MNEQPRDPSRRTLLASGASALAAAGFARTAQAQAAAPAARAALPAYVGWKQPEHLLVHSATTIETRRSAFGTSVITPVDRLYIRNNLPAPDASIVAEGAQGIRNFLEVFCVLCGLSAPSAFGVRPEPIQDS